MKRILLLAAAFAASLAGAAVADPATNSPPVSIWNRVAVCDPANPQTCQGAGYPVLKPSTPLSRPGNTTAYGAGQAVCASTSVACVPLTISVASSVAGQGMLGRVTMLKSGSSLTNAAFTVWFYSASPTVTNVKDASAYVGPFAADMPYYLGSATCTVPAATNDSSAQVWFECALSNPNLAGASGFQAAPGSTNIYAIISATAAYTPASGETFTVFVGGVY